ncbi:uncharacterized protein LOC144424352 [Styela clava]
MERRLMIIIVILALCLGPTNKKLAEYGPVYENVICDVKYFKTTECTTVELDFLKEDYCCKECPDPDGQENPVPENSISCSYIRNESTDGQPDFSTQLHNPSPMLVKYKYHLHMRQILLKIL